MYSRLKIHHVVLASLLLFFVFINGQPINDTDAWWHLEVGEYIWNTGSIPHEDIYSFSNAGHPWITHEWLSEVIYYFAYRTADFQGLFLVNLLLLIAIFYIYLKLLNLRNGGKTSISSILLVIGAFFTFFFWVFRPHMFSHLLFIMFLYILQLYYDDKDYLWTLPILMVLWVNLHGSFIMGPILIAIYLISGLVKINYPSIENKLWSLQQRKKLFIILVLSVAAALVNPNFYDILLYPFQTVDSSYIVDQINEWSSLDFHEPYFLIFLGYMLTGILLMASGAKKHRPVDLLLIGLVSFMSFYAVRNIALFAFTAGPVFGSYAARLLKHSQPHKEFYWLNLILVAVITIGLFYYWPPRIAVDEYVDTEQLPIEAVKYIKREELKGNIFNDYNFGGYLLWTLYPENKVMIDGRTDIYADKVFPDYWKIYRLATGTNQLLNKYDPDIILIGRGSPLDTYLQESIEWHKVYSDSKAVIYLPNNKGGNRY